MMARRFHSVKTHIHDNQTKAKSAIRKRQRERDKETKRGVKLVLHA